MNKNGKRNGKNKACFSGVMTGWKKEYSQIKRRQLVLRSCRGDAASAGNAMLFLVNLNSGYDNEAARKARSDAKYFFALGGKRNGTGRN
jgi:hypothetical protein